MLGRYRRRNNSLSILVILVLVVAVLGVGYAMVTGNLLSISGSAHVTADKSFEVKFKDVLSFDVSDTLPTATNNIQITKNRIIDNTHAEFKVEGLQGYGDYAIVRYSILNASPNERARFTISLQDSSGNSFSSEYFNVDASVTEQDYQTGVVTLDAGDTAYLSIKVNVKKVATTSQSATVKVHVIAEQD